MTSRIQPVDPLRPEPERLNAAADLLRRAALVAFPTETFYALGADATDAAAVDRVFAAKGRPQGMPLPVIVGDRDEVARVVSRLPEGAAALMDVFWPGPLTLVLPRAGAVPLITTGGLETVAARVPSHPVARALIEASGRHIAAPSANRSGWPSPTRAEHVRDDLDGRIELILDGGPTPVGVESTVLDMTTEPPMLLRPGGVTLEDLKDCLGEVDVFGGDHEEAAGRSPGLRYRHYAPRAQVLIVEAGTGERVVVPWLEAGRPVALMTQRPVSLERPGLQVKIMPGDLVAYARELFAALRELDSTGVEGIFVEAVTQEGLGLTIMDRLRRAAS